MEARIFISALCKAPEGTLNGRQSLTTRMCGQRRLMKIQNAFKVHVKLLLDS